MMARLDEAVQKTRRKRSRWEAAPANFPHNEERPRRTLLERLVCTVQVEPRLPVVFSSQCVREAHRLAKHVLSLVTSSS